MRQWILTVLLFGSSLPIAAQQFGPASQGEQLQGLDEIAVVVNNEGITRRQLAAEMARERRALPRNLNIPTQALEEQLIERVIMTHLLAQLKSQLDITITPEEAEQAIAQIAQQNGISTAQLLRNVRRDTGLDKAGYQAQIAESLAEEKLKQGLIGRDIRVTPADIDAQIAQIARHSGLNVTLQDLLLPIPSGNAEERGRLIKTQLRTLSAALKEADGDLQRVAAALPEAKLVNLGTVGLDNIPTRFTQAIATQPIGKVLSEPVIDGDGMHFLKVLGRESNGTRIIPEAKVEHILLRATGEEDFAAQKILIDEFYQRLQRGEDFNALAAQYSQDPNSAARNGALGWMGADQVVPEFAEVMLKAPIGEIVPPFRSSYGWHILRVNDRREVDRSDDILRARIRNNLFNKYLEDAWQQRLIQLRQQAYVDIR